MNGTLSFKFVIPFECDATGRLKGVLSNSQQWKQFGGTSTRASAFNANKAITRINRFAQPLLNTSYAVL